MDTELLLESFEVNKEVCFVCESSPSDDISNVLMEISPCKHKSKKICFTCLSEHGSVDSSRVIMDKCAVCDSEDKQTEEMSSESDASELNTLLNNILDKSESCFTEIVYFVMDNILCIQRND